MRTLSLFLSVLLISTIAQAQVNHRAFIQQARFELSEERFVDALRSLNTAINVRPDLFEPWFLRGVARYNLSDFSGAESDFSEALRQHPLHIRSYHYRGLTRLRLANYHDALQDFVRALELDPYDAGLRLAMGDALLSLNRAQDALTEYGMALTIQPRNAEAWTKRGVANHSLGKTDEALSDLAQAVHYNAFSLDARLRLAMLKAETQKISEALDDFAILSRIHPEEPIVFFQQALVQLESGDTTAALHSLEKVNLLEPSNTLALYNRALICSQSGNYAQAIDLFGKVLERQPTHILSWFNKGVALLKIKEYAESENNFSRSITLFPGFVAAWLNRAEARQAMGNLKGANTDRETAARLVDEQYQPEVPGSPFRNDTLWFNKIMRLESEFAGPGLSGRPQFMPLEVVPFGLFVVVATKRGNESGFLRDDFSAMLDLRFDYTMVFGFIPINTIPGQSLLPVNLDPLPEKFPDLVTFTKSLDELSKGNYQHAMTGFANIDRSSGLFQAAQMNLAAVNFMIESIRADAPHSYEVTIARGGSSTATQTATSQPDFGKAIEILKSLNEAMRSTAFVHHNLGVMLLHNKQYHPAIDAFSDALNINPLLGESWFNRALVLLFLSENRLGCLDLSKAGEQGIVQAYPLIRKYCLKP